MSLRRSIRPVFLLLGMILCGISAQADTFLDRRVDIFDGRSDTSRPAPLVIAMHGFLGTSRNMQRKTGFDALARKHGFVVAYPNGRHRRWNDGRSPQYKVDDAGYLVALINALVANGSVARDKVFLAGHSNGGGMAMRMACERPTLMRAIAVVATKSPHKYQCQNGKPVPAIFFHGTADPISPHAGRSGSSRLGGALSSRATIDQWIARNRCSKSAQTQSIDRRDDGTSAQIFRYKGCAASLVFVLIQGHGHDWPRPGSRFTRLQGPATQEIDAARAAWQFFESQL